MFQKDKLIFTDIPMVTIATNKFVGVPVILQYEDTPLISCVKAVKAGFTTSIPIYNSDGTYLAKVVGSEIYRTKEGEKAGLEMKYPVHRTVCMMNNRVLFEIYRAEAAALKTTAELFTPDGNFVKITEDANSLFNSQAIQVGGVTIMGNTFVNIRIGILYSSDGTVAIGVS